MVLSDWLEIIVAFIVGGGATELIRWLFGKRTRKVQDVVLLANGWEKLAQELQEERAVSQAQVKELATWQESAKVELSGLRAQVALLQTQVQSMHFRVACLEEENERLNEENQALRQGKCLE